MTTVDLFEVNLVFFCVYTISLGLIVVQNFFETDEADVEYVNILVYLSTPILSLLSLGDILYKIYMSYDCGFMYFTNVNVSLMSVFPLIPLYLAVIYYLIKYKK